MEEERIIKIEGTLDRIYYPKYAKKLIQENLQFLGFSLQKD